MKRYLLLASILAISSTETQAASPYYDAIAGAFGLGADLTIEDNSREQWVDVNSNGVIDAGDRLEGFLAFDSFNPPSTSTNNDMYVIFSQTFGTDFTAQVVDATHTIYAGSFESVELNFIEKAGGFSTDWLTADLSGGVSTAIAGLLGEGTSAFKAGLVNPEDFFAFQTSLLITGQTDFVKDPTLTSEVSTSLSLGNFGAGLSIFDVNIPVLFNRTIGSTFFSSVLSKNFGEGETYDLAVVNGNFGGICQDPPSCTATVQNLPDGFVDNADVVLNGTPIPEPSILSLMGLGLLGLGAAKRKNA